MNYGSDSKTAVQARYDAQKIAFAPIMFQASRALRNLGILETLKEHRKSGLTIEEVAEKCSVSVYGAKVLLEAGISLELVYVADSKFFITKTGWFILKDELTRVNMDFTHDVNYPGFFSLQQSIVNGAPEGLKTFGNWRTIYEGLSHLPQHVQKSWFAFDHYYSDVAFPAILPVIFKPEPQKILDVGGNTGKFAVQCAEYNEKVAVTILDLPGQLAKAEKVIEQHGLTDRITCVAADLLDHSKPFPVEYDAIWMSQFLDCFSQEDIVELLRRAKAAIHDEGFIYILETYWDKQRFEASTYCLHSTSLYFTCMANGCSQMYHSEDMLKLVNRAGLEVVETVGEIGISHTLFSCVKQTEI
ncbi:MAG: methyltransferase domain-containing protein [Chitinivibrionales bacterium]|nr:methyltransferase domain-containing protein [Chitinivibrionales bacterium]